MRKTFSLILLSAAVLILTFDFYFLITQLTELSQTRAYLNSINASGMEYLGLDWFLKIGVFVISFFGVNVSVAGCIISKNKAVKIIQYILMGLFAIAFLSGMAG